jgi:hypothetical protein
MNVIKAIYNFVVGDWIILSGILLVVALLGLIQWVSGLAALRGSSGIILVVAILVVLVLTLSREVYGKK